MFTSLYTVLTSTTLKVKVTQILNHPRPHHKEPAYRIRRCCVNYFTSSHVHKVKVNKSIHRVGFSNLESRSRWPNYKLTQLIQDLTIKNPHTELDDDRSIITRYRIRKVKVNKSIHRVKSSDPESRSRLPKYEVIRDLPIRAQIPN